MDTSERIKSLDKLGDLINEKITNNDADLFNVIELAGRLNPWFVKENVLYALEGIISILDEKVLDNWVGNYLFEAVDSRVGLILAGNIPLVGFHDFLSVIISGNIAVLKLSNDDKVLFPYLIKLLTTINEKFKLKVEIVEERLPKNLDAIIATGSNNSARYFDYYFSKYPNIIRKNRNSIAVITGNETPKILNLLGEDVFRYFGLGCRNVSKLFLPKGFKIDKIFEAIFDYQYIIDHNKYSNNYTYQRALLLMDSAPFLDNNFVVLKESDDLISPIGVINYSFYDKIEEVDQYLIENDKKIQCVVSNSNKLNHPRKVALGQAQKPAINDYADGVDTLEFLSKLK